MLLETETKNKFGIELSNLPFFSKKKIIAKCDICNIIFEKEAWKIFSARKRTHSEIDVCHNTHCMRKKREATMLKRYGVINAGLSDVIRKKVQATCFSKYGTSEAMNSQIIRQRLIDGCFKKYGVKNVFQAKIIKEKIKETNRKKYGTIYSKSSDIVKNNTKVNNLIKYGVKNPMMIPDIAQKTSRTWCNKIYETLLKNPLIIPLFSKLEFIGFNKGKSYEFQCIKCKNKFYNNYIGVQCYKCNPLPRSNIEMEIKQYIETIYDGIIKFNIRKEFENKFEVDIFLPEIKTAIEINGNYYHSEIAGQKSKYYHCEKTTKCESRGIKLIHIFEDEWLNKRDIVKDKLLHILNKNNNSLGARKCKIKEIPFNVCCNFLNKTHIQGADKSSIRLGAYYTDELVAAMTFGSIRKIMGYKISNSVGVYELIRFSSNRRVVGIASKLFLYFIKKYNPQKVISYADRRWTTTINKNVYENMGFTKLSNGTPNYWYVHNKNYQLRFHRFNFRKSELSKKLNIFDPNLTEWENMKNNGWDRIWDCGSLKYEWIDDRPN